MDGSAGAVKVRRARRDDDLDALDLALLTDSLFEVVPARRGLGFSLRERELPRRRRKSYELPERERGETWLVAELDGELAGVAVVRHETWNNRSELAHLYVDRRRRGLGVGRALVDAAVERAREQGARALWLETQNVNAPAVRFYRRYGFRLAGLDTTLYDQSEEVALYFALDL